MASGLSEVRGVRPSLLEGVVISFYVEGSDAEFVAADVAMACGAATGSEARPSPVSGGTVCFGLCSPPAESAAGRLFFDRGYVKDWRGVEIALGDWEFLLADKVTHDLVARSLSPAELGGLSSCCRWMRGDVERGRRRRRLAQL